MTTTICYIKRKLKCQYCGKSVYTFVTENGTKLYFSLCEKCLRKLNPNMP